MDKKERVKIWVNGAKRNKKLVGDLYRLKHYDWCLFMWHLVLEKLLKAGITRRDKVAPLVHNLVSLSKIAGLELTDNEKRELSEINTYNVQARYGEYKSALYRKAKKKYTDKWVGICKKYFKKFGEIK